MKKKDEMKSEPLVLEFDDGSDVKDKLEGEAETDTQKLVKALNKLADTLAKELNNPKEEVVKFKDANGNPYKEGNAKGVKLLPEGMKLSLIEAPIPPDMADAYHRDMIVPDGTRSLERRDYIKNSRSGNYNIDFQKAEYNEVTPEEAKKIAKTAPETLRLIFNLGGTMKNGFPRRGFITIDSTGRPSKSRYVELPQEKAYTRKSGEEVIRTSWIPLDHLLKVADKIYVTNEKSVLKDPNLIATRRSNPESKYFRGIDNLDIDELSELGAAYDNHGTEAYNDEDRGSYTHWSKLPNGAQVIVPGIAINSTPTYKNKESYRYTDLLRLKDRAEWLKAKLNDPTLSDMAKQAYQKELDVTFEQIKVDQTALLDIARIDRKYEKDRRAYTRNLVSNAELYKPYKAHKILKKNLEVLEDRMRKAQAELLAIQSNGSKKTLSIKRDLSICMDQINALMRQVAKLNMQLDNIALDDAEAIDYAQQKIDSTTHAFNDTQAKFDILKQTGKYVESYTPWGTAVKLYNRIISEGLEEDFNDMIESLYPQGLTESKKNDLLAYKDEMVKDMLDMED